MLFPPYKDAIPHRGVFISGAIFPDGVDLNDSPTERRLVIHRSLFPLPLAMDRYSTTRYVHIYESLFEQPVVMVSAAIADDLLLRDNIFMQPLELRGVKVGDQLSLQKSIFQKRVVIDSATIRGSAVLDEAHFHGKTLLSSAFVGLQLSFYGAQFLEELNMDSIEVGKSLLFSKNSKFNSTVLRGANIGNQLSASGTQFLGDLDMNSITVGGDLLMKNHTSFSNVNLVGANIGGTLSFVDATFGGRLTLDSAVIGNNLFLERAQFGKPVNLRFVQVGSNLDLRATQMIEIDLTSAKIVGDLRLGSANVREIEWGSGPETQDREKSPSIILHNASVGVLQDTQKSWPHELKRELQGFTYSSLGGFGASAQDVAQARESAWFTDWLNRDSSFSPQPYQQLAQVLREAGHESMATDVLFASRVRERADLNAGDLKWWILWGLQVFVGFGYGSWNFLALAWAAVVSAIGLVVLQRFHNDAETPKEARLGIWYSIDMLLPVIRLREQHYEVDLAGVARYYFYAHKIAGYLLTFFVIAGLSGLGR